MTARGFPVYEVTFLGDDGVIRRWSRADPAVEFIGLYYGTFHITLVADAQGVEVTVEIPEVNAVSAVLYPSGDC